MDIIKELWYGNVAPFEQCTRGDIVLFALVDFLTDDFAFEIVHKSTWHMNTILMFLEKE